MLLSWLKSFQVGKYNPPLNNPTPIEEFKILNETVQESVNQSDKLYNKQKTFRRECRPRVTNSIGRMHE